MSSEDEFTSDFAFVKPAAPVTLADYHNMLDRLDDHVVGRGPVEDRPSDLSSDALWYVTTGDADTSDNTMTRWDATAGEWTHRDWTPQDDVHEVLGDESNPVPETYTDDLHAETVNDTTVYLDSPVTQADLAAAADYLTTDYDGGEVILPDGTFADEWAITSSNITLRGRSKSTTLTLPDGMDEPSQVLTITGDDVIVENLTIDGNRDGQDLSAYTKSEMQHADGIGIYADNCTIRNVDVYQAQSHSIIVWNWTNDLGYANTTLPAEAERFGNVIADCYAEDNGHANNPRASLDTVESRRTIFRDNEVVGGANTSTGITVHTGNDITIRGNNINTEQLGIQIHSGASDIVVDGNKIHSDSGVGSEGLQLYNDTDNITIVNNTIEGDGSRPNLVSFEGTASNVTFARNTVSGGSDGSVRAYTDTQTIRILNNTIIDGARVRVASGATDVQIRGNEFVNFDFWAMNTEDATGVQIQNNRIEHPSGLDLAGSIVLDNGTDCLVSENVIVNSHGVYEGPDSTGNTIRDNHTLTR